MGEEWKGRGEVEKKPDFKSSGEEEKEKKTWSSELTSHRVVTV
jgi:hypothetical protein